MDISTQFAHASGHPDTDSRRASSRNTIWASNIRPETCSSVLVEASHYKIGSPVDNILTYCYRYDPELNKHSLVVARIVQARRRFDQCWD